MSTYAFRSEYTLGIEEELLPYVFECGGQEMVMCKAIVDAHGGRIAAYSPGRGEGAAFVVHDPDGGPGGPGRTTIARLVVGCCAGDATALLVDVRGDVGAPLADDTWVEVTGRFDSEATAEQPDRGYRVPVLHLVSLRRVDAPREPYEYPG